MSLFWLIFTIKPVFLSERLKHNLVNLGWKITFSCIFSWTWFYYPKTIEKIVVLRKKKLKKNQFWNFWENPSAGIKSLLKFQILSLNLRFNELYHRIYCQICRSATFRDPQLKEHGILVKGGNSIGLSLYDNILKL